IGSRSTSALLPVSTAAPTYAASSAAPCLHSTSSASARLSLTHGRPHHCPIRTWAPCTAPPPNTPSVPGSHHPQHHLARSYPALLLASSFFVKLPVGSWWGRQERG
ncbi:hypothetical protein Taro_055448, partial [Colocasia esculenta]|nr:hypothetical protein [Colocasia esculenta]